MGYCRFCNKPAGFLRSAHAECKIRHDEAVEEIITLIEEYCMCGGNMSLLKNNLLRNAKKGLLRSKEMYNLIVYSWEKEVEKLFKNGLATEQQEKYLTDLMNFISTSQIQFSKDEVYAKIVKGSLLRSISTGVFPEETNYNGSLPFNFQKSEKLIWLFQRTGYYELKRSIRYAGNSQGASVRITRGVYVRGSSYRGERIETEEINHVDTGLFGITNKHIYFTGHSRSFRIKYGKIVSFEPLVEGGVCLQRDAMTAKPQYFVTGDNWFTYNLVVNVAQQQ